MSIPPPNETPEVSGLSPRRLRVGYYLENFERLLAETARRYGDLLTEEERGFMARFGELPLDARRLYVRLVTRRGPWFRVDRMRYREIDLRPAIRALEEAGFARRAGNEQTGARLAMVSGGELREWLDEPVARIDGVFRRAPRDAGRAELERAAIEGLGEAGIGERVLLLRLEHIEHVRVFELLFFGNLNQGLSEFVLADLDVVRFERVEISGRSFECRQAVDEHLRLLDALEAVLEAEDGEHEPAAAVARCACQPANRRLRDELLNLLARRLERRGRLEQALALYAEAQAPPSRERRVRILTRLARKDEADTLRDDMRAAPLDEGERLFALRGPRGRRSSAPAHRRLALPGEAAAEAIESRCLTALGAAGLRGFFAENWLWRSLFGLAFWDLVFAPLEGAFVQPFQYAPRDLHDGFRAAREPLVSARLAALRADRAPGPSLLALWDRKCGTANRLVAFAPELRPHLELALGRLTGAQIAAVSDRLSRDLRRYGSGFPDLFLVDAEGDVLLAEVKGPGDTLRAEQEGWIEYLNANGLPTVVLRTEPER